MSVTLIPPHFPTRYLTRGPRGKVEILRAAPAAPPDVVCGLDVDGVLAAFPQHFCTRFGYDFAQWTTWDIPASFGPEAPKQFREFLHDPATWVTVPVIEGAREAVAQLARAHVPTVFLSSLPREFAPLRRWWLERWFGMPFTIHVTDPQDGEIAFVACTAEQKPEVARSFGVTHFCEDRPDTAAAMAEAGIVSYLVPTAYMGTPPSGVFVGTLREFAMAVVRAARLTSAARAAGSLGPYRSVVRFDALNGGQ